VAVSTIKNLKFQFKMVAAAILKNKKWPYFGNGLTDQQEIWHDGANWPSEDR